MALVGQRERQPVLFPVNVVVRLVAETVEPPRGPRALVSLGVVAIHHDGAVAW